MCKDGNCGNLLCDSKPTPRAPLTDCVQESPALPTFPHGSSEEGDELRDACSEVISAACRLWDIIDVSPDDDNEAQQVTRKFLDVIGAIAVLTQTVVAYNEPEDGGEPY